MRSFYSTILLTLSAVGCFNRVNVGPVSFPIDQPKPVPTMDFFDLSATDINGELIKLDTYKGKKVMVVNTASECGYTPQYAQLQELYETYKGQGFVVLGFPCNDFGSQEPGTETEIAQFCQKNYGVTFPMMGKVHVKGPEQHAVYHWLTNMSQNAVMDNDVKWNFHKFLVDEQGHLVMSLQSGVEPSDQRIIDWIEGK
jgi:glutathione peroxidase